MSLSAHLDPLFVLCRRAGLRVGIEESLRAEYLALLAGADGEDLRGPLAAAIVKSSDEGPLFQEAFTTWLGMAPRPAPSPAPPTTFAGRSWSALAPFRRLGGVIGRATARLHLTPQQAARAHLAPAARRTTATDWLLAIGTGVLLGLLFVLLWTEAWDSPAAPSASIERALRQGALVTAAAVLVLLLLALQRSRSRLPTRVPVPDEKGPPRVVLRGTAPAGGDSLRLLGPSDEETLASGIGRFLSDEASEVLDVAASVAATAAADGLPMLRYYRRRHQREVWLWLDDSVGALDGTADATVERLAREVALALTRAGLPVETAYYRGTPERLWSEHGGAFAPVEVDERRDAAIVAIFTDGRQLARRLASARDRPPTEALLRLLSHWPRLAFVDFARGKHNLERLLAPYHIEVLPPEELVRLLAGEAQTTQRCLDTDLRGDALAWAAVCSMAPHAIDEETAFAVRKALDLQASPWTIDLLRASAPGPAGRISWEFAARARLARWLGEAESAARPPRRRWPGARMPSVDRGTILGRTLRFWQERLAAEDAWRSRHSPETWPGSLARQRLLMEEGLLRLWDDPEAATRELYRFREGPLAPFLKERLGELGARDGAQASDLIPLPWRLAERSPTTRVMLGELGLGGIRLREVLRPSRRYLLSVGVSLGLAMAGVAWVVRLVAQ
jgi:hypothetical protein